MISRFFINRPIVAIVIAIVTVIGGLIAMSGLPLALFPEILPPQVIVSTNYTGADAVTIEQSVSTPIEQQMNGVDNMLYMQSVNASDGSQQLTVTFGVDTDVNIDQVNVQRRQPAVNGYLWCRHGRQHRSGQRSESPGAGATESSDRCESVWLDDAEVHRTADARLLSLLAKQNLRLTLSRQLRKHQRERCAVSRSGCRRSASVWFERLCDAHLGEA